MNYFSAKLRRPKFSGSRLGPIIPDYSRLFSIIPDYSRLCSIMLDYARLCPIMLDYSRLGLAFFIKKILLF